MKRSANRADDLEPGERLVLLKGPVPDLIADLGLSGFEEFLEEIRTKGRRYEEARTHSGEESLQRRTPGELIRGPTPEGHVHTDQHRDLNRPGGREAERAHETELWEHRTSRRESP